MRERKDFWDRNAGLYDRFMRKDGAAYEMMYEMIQPVARHKTVLERCTSCRSRRKPLPRFVGC